MTTSDASDSVLSLMDCGKISWPNSVGERDKFIADNFGNVWDALLDININANLEVYSHLDDKLSSTSLYGTCENASDMAWNALGKVLLLVVALEDALGIDITPSFKYDTPDEFSTYKAKIRSRLQS